MARNSYGRHKEPTKSPNTPKAIIRLRKRWRKKIQAQVQGAVVIFDHGDCYADVGFGFSLDRIAPRLLRPGGNPRPVEAPVPKSAKQRMAEGARPAFIPIARFTPEPLRRVGDSYASRSRFYFSDWD